MCTTLRFLEPTILLHRQGLFNFTFLVNRAPLGETVKDENLVGTVIMDVVEEEGHGHASVFSQRQLTTLERES